MMARPVRRRLAGLLLLAAAVPASALGQVRADASAPLTDGELARVTGKLLLPNGAEVALTVMSDTLLNGQLILRTVLAVDKSSQLQVFGRDGTTAQVDYATGSGATAVARPTGVAITLDRQSGIQTVTPTYAMQSSGVTTGTLPQNAGQLGLAPLALVPGGPAIATPDGLVSLAATQNGSLVSLAGDQLAVTNLVGGSIATAVANQANNRTIDSVTTVAIDLRNVQPYQMGSAGLRIDALTLDAARGMVR